eukprot:257971-Hanusia_phi.AAC.2
MPDSQGFCYMFLVRAVLGTPFEARTGGAKRLNDSSVIGVTSQTHSGAFLHKYREFIVYDRNQTPAMRLAIQALGHRPPPVASHRVKKRDHDLFQGN